MSKASVYFTSGNPDGKHNVKDIKQELDMLPGVLSVSVSDSSNQVAVDFDITGVRSRRIQTQPEKMGYQVLDSNLDNHIM